MPRLDGPGLIRCLRRRGQRIPVALMSAASAEIHLPGVTFVPKPFALTHLVQTVWAMLAPQHKATRSRAG
jgi:DNA-binding response OmpR family regulator